MASEIPLTPSTLGSTLTGVTNLANLFLGKSSTTTQSGGTTTQSTNVDPAAVTDAIKQILEGSSGLAAVSSGQKQAGLYNSSTNTLLTNDLVARTAGVAASLNKTVTTSTPSVSSTTTQNPQISTGVAGTAAAALGALQLVPKSVKDSVLSALGVKTVGGAGAGANNTNLDTGGTAQAGFRTSEIADQNASGSLLASGTDGLSGTGSLDVGSDFSKIFDGSGLSGTAGSAVSDSGLTGAATDYLSGVDTSGIGSAISDGLSSAGTAISSAASSAGDSLKDFWDSLSFADGGMVSSKSFSEKMTKVISGYADGGAVVNTGLRATADSTPLGVSANAGSTAGITPAVVASLSSSSGASSGAASSSSASGESGIGAGFGTGVSGPSTGLSSSAASALGTAASAVSGVPGIGSVLGLASAANPSQAMNTIAMAALSMINPFAAIALGLAKSIATPSSTPASSASASSSSGSDADASADAAADASAPDGSVEGDSPGSSPGTGMGIGAAAGSTGAVGSSGDSDGGDSGSSGEGVGGGSGSGGGVGSGSGEGYASGGSVSGPGTSVSDSILAKLSDGEYVIPADVVQALGVGFFDKLRDQYHTPATIQRGA